MKDLWTYDAAARHLTDENGLPVARDVGPQDAGLILSARLTLAHIAEGYQPSHAAKGNAKAFSFEEMYGLQTGIEAAAEVAKEGLDGKHAPVPLDAYASQERPQGAKPRALWLVLDQMLRWNAEAFDAKPDEFWVDVGGCSYGPYPSHELAQDYIDSLGAGFPSDAASIRGEITADINVNGGDLVDSFITWRAEIKAALEHAPGFRAYDRGYEDGHTDGLKDQDVASDVQPGDAGLVIQALELGAGYVGEAIEEQDSGVAEGIYEEDEGEGISTRQEADLATIRAAIATVRTPTPLRVAVFVKSGMVEDVSVDRAAPGLVVNVYDLDVDRSRELYVRGQVHMNATSEFPTLEVKDAPEVLF